MPSSFPTTPDDLGRDNLTHGDVTDALAAVETTVQGLLETPNYVDVVNGSYTDTLTVPAGHQFIHVVPDADPASFPPDVRLIDGAGNTWPLARQNDLAGLISQSSYLAQPATGTILASADFGAAPVSPGADGQVLTADSTAPFGLAYTDPHILHSPNGTAYRLVVADDGTLATEPA